MPESSKFQSLSGRQRIERAKVMGQLDCRPERVDLKRIMAKLHSNRTEEEILAIYDFVSGVKFFRQALREGSVSKETIMELCKGVEMRVYEKNRIVFRQGSIGDAFYLVVEGRMHVLIQPKNAPQTSEDNRDKTNDEAAVNTQKVNETQSASQANTVTDGKGAKEKVSKHGEEEFEEGHRPSQRAGVEREHVNVRDAGAAAPPARARRAADRATIPPFLRGAHDAGRDGTHTPRRGRLLRRSRVRPPATVRVLLACASVLVC